MYHEVTYREIRIQAVRRIVVALLLVAFLVVLYFAGRAADISAREQAAVSIRESVLNAAKQCCAVEGSYPASLSHLEKTYGLSINHEDYLVSYEWFADNMLPTVVVTAR